MGYSTHALGKWDVIITPNRDFRLMFCIIFHSILGQFRLIFGLNNEMNDNINTEFGLFLQVGYIAKACTPTHSGFDTFLGYYEACNHDLFYHTCGKCSPQTCGRTVNGVVGECEVDFSLNVGAQGSIQGAPVSLNGTYSSRAFSARAKTLIASHDTSKPLYMYLLRPTHLLQK